VVEYCIFMEDLLPLVLMRIWTEPLFWPYWSCLQHGKWSAECSRCGVVIFAFTSEVPGKIFLLACEKMIMSKVRLVRDSLGVKLQAKVDE
jgi:hypothetical protein